MVDKLWWLLLSFCVLDLKWEEPQLAGLAWVLLSKAPGRAFRAWSRFH